jgi:arylsulfatase
MPEPIEPQPSVLPIPDRSHVGLTTYDAKDPDTSFPPIEPLRPPEERLQIAMARQ